MPEANDQPNAEPYDALLLASFGGPEGPDDVIPFLENVTAGRSIPRERLAEVGEHYSLFDGKSPLNDLNRTLLAQIRSDFADHRLDVAVYWGNRNWEPYLTDTLQQMAADGIKNAACFVTSAYSSYSGCRQYRENLFAAAEPTGIQLDRLRHYYNHSGFISPFAAATAHALRQAPAGTHTVFVTHSIPVAMNAASGGPGVGAYRRQHEQAASLVAERSGAESYSLVYCSRSGPPTVPWLEPDVNDHLESLAEQGVESVVVVPIGFVSDHMEVIYDLDVEAAETAKRLGMRFDRVPTPQPTGEFVAMIRELFLERAAAERGEYVPRSTLGDLPPSADFCSIDCCVSARSDVPTVGQA